MAPVTSDLLDTTRDKLKMELAANITKNSTTSTTLPGKLQNQPTTKQEDQEKSNKVELKNVEPTVLTSQQPVNLNKSKEPLKNGGNNNGKVIKNTTQVEMVAATPSMAFEQKSGKIPLRLVNSHITCNICRGYLIDATTVVECLHSCKYLVITIISLVVQH